jgi:hypothetical protein
VSEWRFASASTVGASHIRAGLPCQDRIGSNLEEGILVAVAADGAGSARHSDEGAELVVRTILESLNIAALRQTDCLPNFLRLAAARARESVLNLARDRGVSEREFACTLLVTVATPTTTACAHLGDGVIAVCDGTEEWSWVFWPQRGEYANTTRFLTDSDALTHLNVDLLRTPITDFAMMTDGLESLAITYATQTVHDPFFNSILAPLHRSACIGRDAHLSDALVEFLQSPRVAQKADDDLSVIIASRRNTSASNL